MGKARFPGRGPYGEHGPGTNRHRTAARQRGIVSCLVHWPGILSAGARVSNWPGDPHQGREPSKAFFPGLTVNGETDKNTGTMNQDTVIKNSCTGVVQTELFKQKRKKDLQLLAINP